MKDLVELSTLERAVLSAARVLEARRGSPGEVPTTFKSDRSVVTSLDLELEAVIEGELTGTFPIVSEERPDSHAFLGVAERHWVVDPLDGTSTFRRFRQSTGGQVGFGPIVGLVHKQQIVAASFFSSPQRRLFSAVRGEGVYVVSLHDLAGAIPPLRDRRRLFVREDALGPLSGARVLFYPGLSGERRVIEHLSQNRLVERFNNFGGFANHCARLASGFEHVLLQCSVGPWDFAATLFLVEAGLAVLMDPLGTPTSWSEWGVRGSNPLMAFPPLWEQRIRQVLEEVR